jgi:predicted RNA-binding protein with PUA-like domain
MNVDVRLVKKTRLVPLAELREHRELARMRVLQKGNRLSITPVEPAEWTFVTQRLMRLRA